MSGAEVIGLAAAAAAAGAINAVAGGGTLLTFPVLLFAGTPALIANATSTLALFCGTGGSIYGFRRQLGALRFWLRRFAVVSALGGFVGGVLLTRTSEALFSSLVPFLILFATLLFMAQGTIRRFARMACLPDAELRPAFREVLLAMLFQFAIAVYGGYFGAGIGILMLASLGLLGLTDVHEMNALKAVLASLINLVAAAWFVVADLIDWPKAGIMTGGALVGYYLGAHFSQQIPQARVRQLITCIGLLISAVMFYRQFADLLG